MLRISNIIPPEKNIEHEPSTAFSVLVFYIYILTPNMLVSCHQNAGQNQDIQLANRSFGGVSQFKYFGTTIKNKNLIQEKIKRRLNSGNACYHSVQNLLCSHLLLKNVKIEHIRL
jgi:hypothetical protein